MREANYLLALLAVGILGCLSTPSSTTSTVPGSPFCPSTKISYTLNRAQHIQIMIYDVKGNLCDTLLNGVQEKGTHELSMDLRNYQSGVYFYRMRTEDTTYIRKMLLVK